MTGSLSSSDAPSPLDWPELDAFDTADDSCGDAWPLNPASTPSDDSPFASVVPCGNGAPEFEPLAPPRLVIGCERWTFDARVFFPPPPPLPESFFCCG